MIGRLLLIGLLLLAPWAVRAQSEPARFDQGLLWKISQPEGKTSFLFGTLHVSTPEVLQIPAAVSSAFEQSGRMAGEVVLEPQAMRQLAASMFSAEPKLPTLLGDDWPALSAHLAQRGFPAGLNAHLKPWAALLLMLSPKQGEGPVLDDLLQRRARAAGKEVVGLESVEEQIALLSELPLASQRMLLQEALATAHRHDEDIATLTRLYLARDMGAAWALYLAGRSDDPAVRAQQDALTDRLLAQRNALFVERLQPLLQQGGVFVAVGALHLVGERGVPALLEQRGWVLERLY